MTLWVYVVILSELLGYTVQGPFGSLHECRQDQARYAQDLGGAMSACYPLPSKRTK